MKQTIKALKIVHEMWGVNFWEFLCFAEKMWLSDNDKKYMFSRVYWTWNNWACKWKWPRLCAWSFLWRLRKKGYLTTNNQLTSKWINLLQSNT